jgi:dipeptidase
MGDLAMTYGYYGESWDTSRFGAAYVQGDSGEAVSVVDPHEAWVFHITADDSGTKAVWVAQRVPESHVAVVANTFVIREIDPSSPDFLFSDNLWAVAERLGWWSPQKDGLLNFLKVYAPERYHPNYSNRRVWRVFSLAAPSAALSPFTNPTADAYPFSQQVDHLLSLEEVIAFQRDHYQDTPFDTGAGLAGGPYGDPDRFDPHGWGNMTAMDTLEGEFPRTISIHRSLSQLFLYLPCLSL